TSVHAHWQRQTSLLRSAAFLDVADYPVIRFASRAITADGPGRYLVRGQIEIRGVTRPIVLTARLLPAAHAPAGRGQIEEFVVTGRLDRRAFGMTADSLLVSDQVELAIHARIILGSAHGG
ncbi:MAG: YceI family protein, partial [Acetobacteraceae bacterium]